MNNPINEVVPENHEGKAVDLEYSVTEKSVDDALERFRLAYSRLVYPVTWKRLAGAATASFAIWNPEGEEVERHVQLNDYLQIDIPGPGTAAGEGYDWVKIETMEANVIPDADESFVMRVRACENPKHPEAGTAHFFTSDATSTFIIKRQNLTVTFSYHGRNEKANTTEAETIDKVRNKLVAAGAEAGLSEVQWKALLKGVLETEK